MACCASSAAAPSSAVRAWSRVSSPRTSTSEFQSMLCDQIDETVDPPYFVPTHLREPQSIGPLPVRTFYVLLGTGMLLCAPVATLGRRELGDVGLWFGLVPFLLTIPFAVTWLDPPPEH